MSHSRLSLSRHCLPDWSIGSSTLTPQNLERSTERLAYLDGMRSYLESLARSLGTSAVEKAHSKLPYGELFRITPNGIEEISGARQRVSYDEQHVSLAMLDGRKRGATATVLNVGKEGPLFARLFQMLAQGTTKNGIEGLLKASEYDAGEVLSAFLSNGWIEEKSNGDCPTLETLLADGSDRLTWLGHAAAMYQSGESSVAFDLFMRPHVVWTEEEKTRLFSESFGEALLFDDYGPNLLQVSPIELPALDAVLITHQDVDHFALSTLMLLPPETVIVVPKYKKLGPWEVDMKAAVHRFLGPERRVLELDHYESHVFGDIRVTAIPFRQEMPKSLQTNWNSYLLEGKESFVCAIADATLEDSEVDFLETTIGQKGKPLTFCGRDIHRGTSMPGYRDNETELYNFTRLWGWYTPVYDLFSERSLPGPTAAQLERISTFSRLDYYLPYAMGTTPCCRITGVDPLQLEVSNQSAADVRRVDATVRKHTKNGKLFPGKFGKPFRLA